MTPASPPPEHDTNAPWKASVVTLLPDAFPGVLGMSLAAGAMDDGIWTLDCVNLRDFAHDKHHRVDDIPYGGGAGMVLRPDVVGRALDATCTQADTRPVLYLSPRGTPFDQTKARHLSQETGIVVICGRFEGVDQRVLDAHAVEEVSLGDFILSGGEIAAMALIDACVRLLDGVVGSPASLDEESFDNNLLEYPHYTRPRVWQERAVPDVLLNGHHAHIDTWRYQQACALTRTRRPDLWQRHVLDNTPPNH